jgi:hypothetical protein
MSPINKKTESAKNIRIAHVYTIRMVLPSLAHMQTKYY